jgi:hypothetical protein
MAKGGLVLHNAGDRFSIDGVTQAGKLTPEQILEQLKKRDGS